MNDVAVPIGKDLNFDVARSSDVFLDQHAAGAECGCDFAHGAFKRSLEFGLPCRPAACRLPPPPAAGLISTG